jgi:hypothetical protein
MACPVRGHKPRQRQKSYRGSYPNVGHCLLLQRCSEQQIHRTSPRTVDHNQPSRRPICRVLHVPGQYLLKTFSPHRSLPSEMSAAGRSVLAVRCLTDGEAPEPEYTDQLPTRSGVGQVCTFGLHLFVISGAPLLFSHSELGWSAVPCTIT